MTILVSAPLADDAQVQVENDSVGEPQIRDDEGRPGVLARAEGRLGSCVRLFKLLSDETRFRVLLTLCQDGEANVQTLCRRLGQSQPAISHHLALLKDAGMVRLRRQGKHNFYRLEGGRMSDMLRDVAMDLARRDGP